MHHFVKTEREHLRRSLNNKTGRHVFDNRQDADFTGCPRPLVCCDSKRDLKRWRMCAWGGSPGLQTALSLDNQTILWAYRRIWGKTPMWVNHSDYDFPIAKAELFLIAFHVCGYDRDRGGPPMKQVIREIPAGPCF